MINLSANTIGIGIAVHLRDHFTAKSRSISSEFDRLYGNARRVQEENLRAVRRVGFAMMIAGGIGVRGFAKAVNVAADFKFTMQTIRAVTEATVSEIAEMETLVLRLGRETIYTADEVASAMEYLVRSGFKYGQAMGALPGVVMLGAAAGGKHIGGKGGIADLMASILHQFNKDASMSTRLADLLAKAANISASDVEDLGHALKYSAGQMHMLDIEIEESLAMLTVLSNAGLKGGIAGRALNAMIMYLGRAVSSFRTTRQVEAFKAIGLDIQDIVDSTGNLKPMLTILDAFGRKIRSMPKVEAVGALATLFQLRGQRAMYPLLEESLKIGYNFEGALKQLVSNSADYSSKISNLMMDTLKGDMMILRDTWHAFKIEVGSTVGAVLRPVIRFFTVLLNKVIEFSKTPLGKPLILLAAGLSLATLVAGSLLVAFTSIKLLTIASTVSFVNMGKSLALAWNTGTAAALRYMTVARGAMLTSVGGKLRWRNIATGQFVAAPAAATVATGAANKGLWAFIKNLFQASSLLKILGNVAKVVTGPIGWFVTILGGMVGFRNMLKLVIFSLGTLVNAIIFAGQVVWGIFKNWNKPWNWASAISDANKRYAEAQENMIKSFGMREMSPGAFQGTSYSGGKTIGFEEVMKKIEEDRARRGVSSSKAKIQLYMDGKEIGTLALDSISKDLKQRLEVKSN